MKLSLATLLPSCTAAVVALGQFSPTDATSRGAMIERALSSQTTGDAHPFFGLPLPSAPRRRAQEEQGALSLSQECMGDWLGAAATDETAMELLSASDCQTDLYAGDTGEMVEMVALPRCYNMSAFLDYCDSNANYKTFEYPNIKLTCLYDGIPVSIYPYGESFCTSVSCPSDPADFAVTDIAFIWEADPAECTVEILEEGEGPPPEAAKLTPETLSQQCQDELDIYREDPDATKLHDDFYAACGRERYQSSNNETVLLADYKDCDYIASNFIPSCESKGYQTVLVDFLHTCNGSNVVSIFYGKPRCVPMSCPSSGADYLALDIQYSIPDVVLQGCDYALLEEGYEPPSRVPATDGDNNIDIVVEDGTSDAVVAISSRGAVASVVISLLVAVMP